jgi:hypothetical protein
MAVGEEVSSTPLLVLILQEMAVGPAGAGCLTVSEQELAV